MDVESAREALRSLDPPIPAGARVEPVPGGWSFWTFRVGGDLALRFPKSDEAVRGLERERRLLPELSDKVSFRVPVPAVFGRHDGRPFQVAPWIEGRPVRAEDVSSGAAPSPEHAGDRRARVSRVLAELHGFPRARAAALLEVQGDVAPWHDRYRGLRETVALRVEPLLDAPLRDRIAVGFARFLEDEMASFAHPVLVHGDLGVSHLLVDDDGFASGVIDFESAAVGDPAIDFVGLQIAFGDDVVRDVLARYGGEPDPGFRGRLHFYVWMGSVHAILYGLDQGDDALVGNAIRTLAERIGV